MITDRKRETNRAWKNANRGRMNRVRREYYQANKDRIQELSKIRRETNPAVKQQEKARALSLTPEQIEARRARQYAYYHANKERMREYARQAAARNSDRIKLYKQTPKARYFACRKTARRRGVVFNLSLEQYVNIVIGASCHYCNRSLPPTCGSSLDRVDPTKGYIPGNVVPCCSRCNTLKMDMTTTEFLEAITAVYERRHAWISKD